VKITWQAAPGAYGYIVYRSTSKSGTYSNIANTSNTNYTNSYITTGKTYYYKVRAYNNIATSKIYGSYSAITAATPVLTAPSVYVYSNAGSKAKLSWKSISGASGYIIYRSTLLQIM
jgi:fibronectin type 3 domain-containing protein